MRTSVRKVLMSARDNRPTTLEVLLVLRWKKGRAISEAVWKRKS